MGLRERINRFQIEKDMKTLEELSKYLRISRPTINKVLKGEKITEFIAWKMFVYMDGYVLFEELVEEISEKYWKRLQAGKCKMLKENHLRIISNECVTESCAGSVK